MNRNVTIQSIINRLRMRRTLVQVSIFVLCLFTLVALGFGAQAWTGRQLFGEGFESVNQIIGTTKPPLYEAWHAKELSLPQHDASLPFPEGASGRYLYVGNRMTVQGFGNYMQEALMNAYLAEISGRAFVFDNYTWEKDLSSDYSKYNNKLIPARIPFSVYMTGAAFGAQEYIVNGKKHPRSVRKEYFDTVCPDSEKVVLKSEDVDTKDVSVETILDRWTAKLDSISERCVEIGSGWPIFHWGVFEQKSHILDVWPAMRKSGVYSTLEWSPLIYSAFDVNRYIFDVRFKRPGTPSSVTKEHSKTFDPIPGLLALHIRRGDFSWHCQTDSSGFRMPFNAFNAFPEFPDQFKPPSHEISNEESWEIYEPRCYPSIEQIIERVEAVRAVNPSLHTVYVLSNAPRKWVDGLFDRMRARHTWRLMGQSRDLELTTEQRYIAQAVDMLIAQRAEVLIGNGFSSLTSNVVMLRMAKGSPPSSNRMW